MTSLPDNPDIATDENGELENIYGDLVVYHGKNCPRAIHKSSGGYLHSEADDGPYYCDGVMYCGRCHVAL